MDISLLRQHLQNVQKKSLAESALDLPPNLFKFLSTINPKIDFKYLPNQMGHRGADGFVAFRSSSITLRSLFVPTESDVAVYGKAALRGVYRWYHNDTPPGRDSYEKQAADLHNPLGGSGLVKLDLQKGTIHFLDAEKMEKDDSRLQWEGRKYDVKRLTAFTQKFIEQQV